MSRCATLRVDRRSLASKHRFAGAPSPDAPTCPYCRRAQTPIFRLDFDDPALASLGVWDGVLTTHACLDCVLPALRPLYFAHPFEGPPTFVSGPTRADVIQIGDALTPRAAAPLHATNRAYEDDAWSLARVGGPICWLGAEPLEGATREIGCAYCGKWMHLVAQWADARLWAETDEPIYTQPYVLAWLGCRTCRCIATVQMID